MYKSYSYSFSNESLSLIIDGRVYIEKWKDVFGYEGKYQVSSFGRIKTLPRKHCMNKEIILKGCPDKNGYMQVAFWKCNKTSTQKVHRLVAKHFVKNTENKPQVNHKNGIKDCNFYKNLEWVTNQENQIHARDTGLNNSHGERSNLAKLNKGIVLEIFNSKLLQKELAKIYNVRQTQISRIKNGRCWSRTTGKKYQRIRKY